MGVAVVGALSVGVGSARSGRSGGGNVVGTSGGNKVVMSEVVVAR